MYMYMYKVHAHLQQNVHNIYVTTELCKSIVYSQWLVMGSLSLVFNQVRLSRTKASSLQSNIYMYMVMCTATYCLANQPAKHSTDSVLPSIHFVLEAPYAFTTGLTLARDWGGANGFDVVTSFT